MLGTSNTRQKSKLNIDEEERKVRSSLSRLIHTLQHFPSKRSGLDTNSLWTLVDDLESFKSDRKTRSFQFTQTTEKKTFSKKCVDLKVCPSTEINSSKENHKFDRKINNNESTGKKPNSTLSSKFNQSKKKIFQKPNLNINFQESYYGQEERPSLNIKNAAYKKGGQGDYCEGNLLNKNNTPKEQYPNIGHKYNKSKFTPQRISVKTAKISERNLKRNNSSLKDTGLYNSSFVKQNSNAKHTLCHESSSRSRSTLKYSTLNNYKPHQCSPKSNKALQNIMLKNKIPQMDKSSMVKKLTDYWNNILNNDSEEDNDDKNTNSSLTKCKYTKSLEELIQGPSESESGENSENNSLSMNSRHMSESNINIMKRLEELNSDCLSNSIQLSRKNSEIDAKPNIANVQETSVPVQLNPHSNPIIESPSVEVYKDAYNNLKNTTQHSDMRAPIFQDSKPKCELHTDIATAELQNLLYTLKALPPCDILSEEVKLSQPIKKLIYVMISSLKKAQKEKDSTFLTILEIYVDQIINEIKYSNPYISGYQSYSSELEPYTSAESITSTDKCILIKNNTNKIIHNLQENEDCLENVHNKSSESIQNKDVAMEIDDLEAKTDKFQVAKIGNQIVKEIPTTIAVPGLNLYKVERALKLFMMSKILWEKYFVFLNNYDDFSVHHNQSHQLSQSHSFTIICEEEIILEEDCPEYNINHQYCTNQKYETNLNQCRSLVARIENFLDKIIDLLENYWPDTLQTLVLMIYQATVSVLIWWVIVKEIFSK